MRWPSRARVSPNNPRAFAICDRCGQQYNIDALNAQFQYTGTGLYNTGMMVCSQCLDVPNPQLLARAVGPDPTPVPNARPRRYRATEGLSAQTVLLVNQMENWPSQHVLDAVDALMVVAVIPLISKLDVFYMALEDQQQAALNWVNPGTNTLVSATDYDPQFFRLEGWKNVAGTAALDTEFQPAIVGSKMQQNTAHLGVLATTCTSSPNIVGNTTYGLSPNNIINNVAFRISQAASTPAIVGTGNPVSSYAIASRSDSANAIIYRTGASTTIALPSETPSTRTLWIGGSNQSTPAYGTLGTVRCFHAGSALTPADVALLTDAIADFVAAVDSPL